MSLTIHHVARVCGCLNAAKARYLVVGGIAVGADGVPRGTEDLDLAIDPPAPMPARC